MPGSRRPLARTRRSARWLRDELRTVRRYRREHGLRQVLLLRAREHAGMAGVDTSVAVATWQHHARLAELEERVRGAERLEARVREAERGVEDARVAAVLDATERTVSARLEDDAMLVSVVLPTYDRPEHLRRAIRSVLAQLHHRLELLVVDAGGRPGTAAVIEEVTDPRLRRVAALGARSGEARNAGLEQARGELVAYLDDDNIMQPWWLRAAVLTARHRPDANVFYGARVVEWNEGTLATVQYAPAFDRERFLRENIVDTNVLAHRRGLGPRWPQQSGSPDWEYVAALLAAGHEPVPVPVRAVLYMASAPSRFTDAEDFAERSARARAEVQRLLA